MVGKTLGCFQAAEQKLSWCWDEAHILRQVLSSVKCVLGQLGQHCSIYGSEFAATKVSTTTVPCLHKGY